MIPVSLGRIWIVPAAHTIDEFILGIWRESGRHPEVIKAVISAANTEKNKSIRPLKSNLAKLQKRFTEINNQLQRYLNLARKTDSAHFGRETLAAAEDLAKQKQEMEREIEKLKIDIAYREKVVTDEVVIANALLTFQNTVKVLPFDDQRELLQLLVKGIRVDRLDPKKGKIPAVPLKYELNGLRSTWSFMQPTCYQALMRNTLRVRI